MKAIVSLSGGMDSATILAYVLYRGYSVEAIGFTYGSKHNQYENLAAVRLAEFYKVPFRVIDLSAVFAGFKSNLLLDGGAIPEGYYEGENMRQTVVPGRNAIFTTILAGLAESTGACDVFLGVHAGDHEIYPDCRPEFLTYMRAAILASTDGRVTLRYPFETLHKQHILTEGFRLGVPYALTRTCYKDQAVACGKCGSCQERLTAFHALYLDDPIEYETRELLPR